MFSFLRDVLLAFLEIKVLESDTWGYVQSYYKSCLFCGSPFSQKPHILSFPYCYQHRIFLSPQKACFKLLVSSLFQIFSYNILPHCTEQLLNRCQMHEVLFSWLLSSKLLISMPNKFLIFGLHCC